MGGSKGGNRRPRKSKFRHPLVIRRVPPPRSMPYATPPVLAPEGCAGLLDFNLIFRRWLRFRSTNVATFRMKTLARRGVARSPRPLIVIVVLSSANSHALTSENTGYPGVGVFFVSLSAVQVGSPYQKF